MARGDLCVISTFDSNSSSRIGTYSRTDPFRRQTERNHSFALGNYTACRVSTLLRQNDRHFIGRSRHLFAPSSLCAPVSCLSDIPCPVAVQSSPCFSSGRRHDPLLYPLLFRHRYQGRKHRQSFLTLSRSAFMACRLLSYALLKRQSLFVFPVLLAASVLAALP